MGPTKKKKDKTKNEKEGSRRNWQCGEFERDYFSFFFFSIRFSQIHKNLTVRIRHDKHEKCSTRRGLCVGTRNTGFH